MLRVFLRLNIFDKKDEVVVKGIKLARVMFGFF